MIEHEKYNNEVIKKIKKINIKRWWKGLKRLISTYSDKPEKPSSIYLAQHYTRIDIKTDSKWMPLINDRFTTISDHFFSILA